MPIFAEIMQDQLITAARQRAPETEYFASAKIVVTKLPSAG